MFDALPITWIAAITLVAAVAVIMASIRATALADVIADRTAMGEAMVGGIVVGGATSLSGIVVSVTAASQGDASFAVSNAVGGIAAQTVFLVLADLFYRGPNLEHAAADPANLLQTVLLIGFLSLAVAAMAGPDLSVWGIHPASAILALAYVGGMSMTAAIRDKPMWRPVRTSDTRRDEPEDAQEKHKPVLRPVLIFSALVAVMGICGWIISQSGTQVIARYGLASSLVGALGTAVVTSIPELVTTLTAIRRGALQLAVGGIVGGNTFDTLFLTFADVAYRDGSIYHAASRNDLFWMSTGLVMTTILLAGLVLRQREGPARIGVESVLILAVYVIAVVAELWQTA